MLSLLFKQPHVIESKSRQDAGAPRPVDANLVAVKAAPQVVAAEAPVIGVLGAKGGVGTTTIAINLASALVAEFGSSTLLDSNLQQPDAANILGVDVKYSLLDLLARQEFSADILDACCNTIAGVRDLKLLTAPTTGQGGLQITLTQVADCLDSVRKFSGSWVVDLPRFLDRHLVTLVDHCSVMLIVFEPTLAGVGAARRWLRLLAELEYPPERTLVVINRSGSKLRTAEQEITTALSDLSVFKIPNAYEMAEECTVAAAPVVVKFPGSAYSRAIKGLAKHVAGIVKTADRGKSV